MNVGMVITFEVLAAVWPHSQWP